jgi:hypothetical protein
VHRLLSEARKDSLAGRDAVKGWEAQAVAEAGKDASVSSTGQSRSTSRRPGGGVLPATTSGKKGATDLARPATPGPIPSKTKMPTRHLDERGEGTGRGELEDGPARRARRMTFSLRSQLCNLAPLPFCLLQNSLCRC